MVEAKQAVANAQRYLQDMFGGTVGDVLLEEVELSDNRTVWYITLSFIRSRSPVTPTGSIAEMLPQKNPRHYKVFGLNAETGEVAAMKIRENAQPD